MAITKKKRFLGNTKSKEVHDTSNENANCQLGEIKLEHRRWYETLTDAKRDLSYDNCHWCLTGSKR